MPQPGVRSNDVCNSSTERPTPTFLKKENGVLSLCHYVLDLGLCPFTMYDEGADLSLRDMSDGFCDESSLDGAWN